MQKNVWSFKSPTSLVFGDNVALELGAHLNKLGIKKALLVTDELIVKLGIAKRTLELATTQHRVEFATYSGVHPEPPVENAYDALAIYQQERCDGIVGIGGGSPLDVAKAVALLATNGGKYENYTGIGKVPKKCAPLVLMPTTSGTGSEVSMFSIMIVNGAKAGVVDENITANLALVDPVLTVSAPPHVTAATGLDAFCHHLESFLSVNASVLHQPLCLDGIRVISKYLRKAVGDGQNAEARYQMAYASTMGGYASNLSEGAAANHGLAFALGAKFHIGHGLANAVLLRHVLPVVGRAELEKVRMIGEAMGEKVAALSDVAALDVTVGAIHTLVRDVGCDIPLGRLGAKEADLDDLVAETNRQTRVMGHSTYKLSSDEIRSIFAGAL
jgi:alcohol dehydrogenase class IV